MNDLALIAGSRGRVGTLERIMPEYLSHREDGVTYGPSGAVGMLRTSRVTRDPQMVSGIPDDDVFASIIVTCTGDDESELSEFYGVALFKPLEGVKWRDQIAGICSKPSMFEVVSPLRLESGADYAFYAKRAVQTKVRGRRKL